MIAIFFLCGEFECVQRVLQIWIWGGGGVVSLMKFAMVLEVVLCIQPFFIFFVVCCWISLFYRTHYLSRDMHASWIRSKRNIQLNDLAATTSELYIYRGDV